MKKLSILWLAFSISICAIAQKKAVNSAENALDKGELDKALELIQPAFSNDETKDLPNTWFVKGVILQKIAISQDEKYKNLVEDPATEAYNSYIKAIELDTKQKINKKIDLQLITKNELYIAAANRASEYFNAGKYDRALALFELALKIKTFPIYKNEVDTIMIYNCGLAANNAKNYDKAIEYFNKSVSYKYNGGTTYSLLKMAYVAKGDSASAIAAMQKGFELYPNDLPLIVDLVNYYLNAGKSTEALSYLDMAKKKDPTNASFLFAEGTLYEKMGDYDKAVVAYTKSGELDPKYFNAFYNLGVLYYNKAVKIFDQAANEKDDTKYNDLLKKGDEELKLSIPHLEMAHTIDPKDEVCAKTLKGLYFRMQMKDKLDALTKEMGW